MQPAAIHSADVETPWPSWLRICFRFFFLFLLGTSLAGYNIFLELAGTSDDRTENLLAMLNRPLAWIDGHFFHIGFTPGKDPAWFGDGAYGAVLLLTIFFISLIGMICWTILDRRRTNYNRLHYWFRTYLAYYLFLALIPYAVEKIYPVQMPFPNVVELLKPLGYARGDQMVWDFMGSNPHYSFFTGLSELIGALLILFKRTRVFGSLLLATILANVACLNFFYNIGVKMMCAQLFLTNLFLLVPFLPKLFSFFYRLEPVSLRERMYIFHTPWKKWALMLLLLAPAWSTFRTFDQVKLLSARNSNNRRSQRLYDVQTFISGTDTLAPLENDPFRWKRFAITDYQGLRMAVVYNMQDRPQLFGFRSDTANKTFVLINRRDTSTRFVFSYSQPTPDQWILTGKWKEKDVRVLMARFAIDSLPMLKQQITWLH